MFTEDILALNYHGSGDYAVLLECTGPNAVGFHRQYFTNAKCFGARLLSLAGLELITHAHGQSARAKWDNKIVEHNWLSMNVATQAYIDANIMTITRNQSLLKDLTDPRF